MITRKLGKILRGKATPYQIFLACLLGVMLGFVPSVSKAAGLVVFLTGLLIILNANLALAALVAIVSKILSLAIAPMGFQVGRFLLDGPTQGLFESMINAPVLALFGFEYYLTTGNLALGLILGILLGFFMTKTIVGFRKKMASLEEGSEGFKKWTSKWYVRFLIWIFFGKGKGKKTTYEDVLSKKIGNPIRVVGVIFVVAVGGLAILVAMFMSSNVVHGKLQAALQDANGATVDIGSVDMDLREGKLVIQDLAMADPDDLETDLLRTDRLEADLGVSSLLSKRVQIDKLLIDSATSGEKRAVPGKLIGEKEPGEEAPPPQEEGVKSIDDYLADAKEWKEKLAKLKEWTDKLSGPEDEEAAEEGPKTPEEEKESLRDLLQRQIDRYGYGGVRADHLIAEVPRFVLSELVMNKVSVPFLEESLSLTGADISSNPKVLGKAPSVQASSGSDTFAGQLVLAGAAGLGDSIIDAVYKQIPVDSFADQLKFEGTKPLQGGTMDLDIDGRWPATDTDKMTTTILATLYETTVTIPDAGSQKVSKLVVPLEITGPLTNPGIRLDSEKLADALLKAGADELANRVRAEADKVIDEAVQKGTEEAEKLVDEAVEKGAEAVTEKVGEELKEKVGEELKEKVGDEAEEKAKELIKDLPWGKKKD